MRPHIFILLLAAAIGMGCDTTAPSEHVREVVVESYLVAGEPISTVRLSYTEAVGRAFDLSALAVTDALVRIELLDESGSIEREFAYISDTFRPGVYVPAPTASPRPDLVLSGRQYRLHVETADGARITSVTRVPGAFEAVRKTEGSLPYRSTQQYEMDLTPSVYPGRQGIFVISIEAMDPNPDQLVPFYLDAIYEVGDGDPWNPADADTTLLAEYRVNASPPINEANYERNPDGTLRVRLPWFGVVFYGLNRISLSAIDDNVYDFIRFQSAQQGGASLSPGEIPNVLDHVDGGTGVFGSYARASGDIEITR